MGHLSFNFAELQPTQRYKLLCGLVVPRPIALVTSTSPDGVVNAAPFSFFNVFSEQPALIVLGLQHNADGSPKDTTRNIQQSGEFVVNLVDEGIAEAMNLTATDFPPGEGEPMALGIATLPSMLVKPPRLAAAPAAFECRRTVGLAFGPQRELLIGEVLGAHVREGVLDPTTLNVDFAALAPVGRLCGAAYARQRDRFELKRINYAEVASRAHKGCGLSELHGADGHRHRGLRRVEHGYAERGLEGCPVPGHASAAHDDDVGRVLIAQLPADSDHLFQRLFPCRRFGHADVEGALAGEAAVKSHLT